MSMTMTTFLSTYRILGVEQCRLWYIQYWMDNINVTALKRMYCQRRVVGLMIPLDQHVHKNVLIDPPYVVMF